MKQKSSGIHIELGGVVSRRVLLSVLHSVMGQGAHALPKRTIFRYAAKSEFTDVPNGILHFEAAQFLYLSGAVVLISQALANKHIQNRVCDHQVLAQWNGKGRACRVQLIDELGSPVYSHPELKEIFDAFGGSLSWSQFKDCHMVTLDPFSWKETANA